MFYFVHVLTNQFLFCNIQLREIKIWSQDPFTITSNMCSYFSKKKVLVFNQNCSLRRSCYKIASNKNIFICICVNHWVLILQHSTQRIFKASFGVPMQSYLLDLQNMFIVVKGRVILIFSIIKKLYALKFWNFFCLLLILFSFLNVFLIFFLNQTKKNSKNF